MKTPTPKPRANQPKRSVTRPATRGIAPQPTGLALLPLLAVALTAAAFLLYPAWGSPLTGPRHGVMTLMLWGLAGLLCQMVYFRPHHLLPRTLLHPTLAWVLVLGGWVFLLSP